MHHPLFSLQGVNAVIIGKILLTILLLSLIGALVNDIVTQLELRILPERWTRRQTDRIAVPMTVSMQSIKPPRA